MVSQSIRETFHSLFLQFQLLEIVFSSPPTHSLVNLATQAMMVPSMWGREPLKGGPPLLPIHAYHRRRKSPQEDSDNGVPPPIKSRGGTAYHR